MSREGDWLVISDVTNIRAGIYGSGLRIHFDIDGGRCIMFDLPAPQALQLAQEIDLAVALDAKDRDALVAQLRDSERLIAQLRRQVSACYEKEEDIRKKIKTLLGDI